MRLPSTWLAERVWIFFDRWGGLRPGESRRIHSRGTRPATGLASYTRAGALVDG